MRSPGMPLLSPSRHLHGVRDAGRQADRVEGVAGVETALRRNKAFANWPDSTLGRLGSKCRVVWLERGERLCREVARGTLSYVVQSGWLMLQVPSRKEDVPSAVAMLGEGMMVCSLMPDKNLFGSFDASAQRETALVEIPSAALQRQLDESPHLWADLALALLDQEEGLLATVVGQATGTVAQRVTRTLLQYTQLCSDHRDEHTDAVKVRMSQDELGTLLQLSRKTVGRELRALEGLDLIVRRYNHILVRDLVALQHYAERGTVDHGSNARAPSS